MKYPIALQHLYAPEFCHCFGCGSENNLGLHLCSYLSDDGTETYCSVTPREEYTGGIPNNLYGGAIAMYFDCHGTGSAVGFYMMHFGISPSEETIDRFVTAHLSVDYLLPTPMSTSLRIIARPEKVTEKKVIMSMEMWAKETCTAKASMVAVRIPKNKD